MMKQAFVRLVVVALGLLAGSAAVRADAPAYIPIQGYLANAAGTPIDSAVSIRFRLYDAATAGAVLFDETKSVVNIEAGYFTAYLGEETPIDLSVFSAHPLVFVGVLVSGDTAELSPRLQLATAPYAAFAQSCGDASTFQGKGPSDFLSKTYSPAWSEVTGKPATFSPSSHGHAWSDLTSGVPSGLADGDDDSLAALSCANGQVAKRTGGAWACGADTDTNTTYSAGTGLSLTGTQFSVNPATVQSRVASSCTGANQSIKTIGSDGTTTCETDDVGPTYTAGAGINIVANKLGMNCQWEFRAGSECAAGAQCDVICSSGKFVLTGGCDAAGTATIEESYPHPQDDNYKSNPSVWPLSTSAADVNVPFINTWGCQPSSGGTFNSVYALCCTP